jgi:hypothetical protein
VFLGHGWSKAPLFGRAPHFCEGTALPGPIGKNAVDIFARPEGTAFDYDWRGEQASLNVAVDRFCANIKKFGDCFLADQAAVGAVGFQTGRASTGLRCRTL